MRCGPCAGLWIPRSARTWPSFSTPRWPPGWPIFPRWRASRPSPDGVPRRPRRISAASTTGWVRRISTAWSGSIACSRKTGKRLLVGESLFMTVFMNQGQSKKKAAFAAPYPGKIVAIHLAELGGELLAQKDSFLVAAKGVSLGIAFTKRFGAGLFGGEGFILERLQGDGLAFIHAGGAIYQRDLAPGELLRVDTGCIVAFQPSVNYDIQMVGGIKSALFG